MGKFPLLGCGFLNSTPPTVKANLREFVRCCLEFVTFESRIFRHVPFPKQPFWCQITDYINAMIDKMIPVHGAGAWLLADVHGLSNLWDVLPHCIISSLHCQSSLLLPNPLGFYCQLADYNTSDLSPKAGLLIKHLDCISICDDCFRQPEGITLHFRFPMVVNNRVVDFKCSLL